MNRKQILEMKLMNIIRPMVEQILNEEDTLAKTVADFLPMVKPSSKTYYNLDDRSKDMFKKLYSYLVKHKDKQVGLLGAKRAVAMLDTKEMDYVKKYKAMEIISQNINH